MTQLKRGRWSTPELARLRELFPRMSVERLAQSLNRSVESVRAQAARLFGSIADGAKPAEFEDQEDEVLRRGHGIVCVRDLALVLGRQAPSVERRVVELRSDLRHGPWEPAEIALLKELYSSRPDEVLEVCLSRDRADIAAKATEYCLRKDKGAVSTREPGQSMRMPRWSPEEVEYLERRYPTRTNLRIARELGRSVTSVANKAHQLGLKKATELRRQIGAENALGRRAR